MLSKKSCSSVFQLDFSVWIYVFTLNMHISQHNTLKKPGSKGLTLVAMNSDNGTEKQFPVQKNHNFLEK